MFSDTTRELAFFPMHETIARTEHLELYSLILSDRVGIPLAFVLFTIEVLDSFVIEQAVGMDASRDLCNKNVSICA